MGKIGEPVKCANDGCDTIFIRKTSAEKYCCDECKKEAINRKRREKRHGRSNFTPGVSRCAYCGKEFWQKTKNNIYCCEKCCRRALKRKAAREKGKEIKTRKPKQQVSEKHIMPKELFVKRLSNDLFWAHK